MKKTYKHFLIVALGMLLFASGCSDDEVIGKYQVIVNTAYAIPSADLTTTTGTVPVDATNYKLGDEITLLGNTGNLVKTGGVFAGWTIPGSTTTVYQPGDKVIIPPTLPSSTFTITVKWTTAYKVTYNGNGSDGGTAPVDANQYIAGADVLVANVGDLTKTGFTFNGWNTAANGSGTARAEGATFAMGTANVTLYAQWQ